ncbi:MAG: TetR/AcrR family transcriptional regulator [Lachnospiraceae bacterium]|nr:TetR/AcrR family transcriptional regulator [Lachnospiraceae bacterium]
MLKKLTEEKIEEILEAGIKEFAAHGLLASSMNSIAARAGISVGVLYKYYEDKNDFFLACLKRSLSVLEDLIGSLKVEEDDPFKYAEALIDAVLRFSSENPEYMRMYHEITTGEDRELSKMLSGRIEALTAGRYTEVIKKAQENGIVKKELDPALAAFFFDNLLMMLQFSCCCTYYQERYIVYRGRNIYEEQELVKKQLLAVIRAAFSA